MEIFCSFQKPSFIKAKSLSLPSLSWGYGMTLFEKNQQDNVYLGVAWDKYLFMFNFMQIIQKYDQKTKFVDYQPQSFYINEHPIHYVQWISNNLIMIIDAAKQIKLLYYKHFLKFHNKAIHKYSHQDFYQLHIFELNDQLKFDYFGHTGQKIFKHSVSYD